MFRRNMKKTILDEAGQIIASRRNRALKTAMDNKEKALAFPDFKALYSKYMELVINEAKNGITSSQESTKLQEKIRDFLKKHNIGSINPTFSCKKCEDTGFVDGKRCTCLTNVLNEILKKESGFGEFENFEQSSTTIFHDNGFMEKLYDKMKQWCHSDFKKNIIFISGDTGVGKTYLTKCMASELITLDYLVFVTSSFKLHQDFVKSYSCRDFEEKNAILDKYFNAEILFIDDLGSELRVPNVTNGYLYQIINERKAMKKPTIITSNLDVYEIKDYYDERISSRIIDRENSICLQIKGEDLRLKK